MAISKVADRAQANSNSAVTTVDLVLASLTVGNLLIIRTAADNSGGGGAARTVTVTNQSGTAVEIASLLQYQRNNDPGAASAGVTANLVVAKITATSGTVRLTYSGSVVQACVAEEWAGLDNTMGSTTVVGTPVGADGVNSTSLASLTDASVASGNLAYAAMAVEGPSSDTYTQDSDTTNGSWSDLTKLGTSNATADTNQTVYGGYKVVTGTGGQTYNPTINNQRDSAGIIAELAAKVPVTGTALGAFGSLTATAVGTPTVLATSVGSFGGMTATAVGTPTVAGVAAGSLGGLTATATGTVPVLGTAAASFGALTATSAGTPTVAGTAAGVLGGLTATAVGTRTVPGSAVGAFGGLTASAAGTRSTTGVAVGDLGSLTAMAAGVPTVSAIATGSFDGLLATATALVTVTAAATGDLGALLAVASGTVTPGGGGGATVTGVAAGDLGGLAATAVGVPFVMGAAAAGFGGLEATAVGMPTVVGAAAGNFGVLTGTAAGWRSLAGAASAVFGGLAATVVVAGPVRDINVSFGPAVNPLGVGAGHSGWASGPLAVGWPVSQGSVR
jgi:hypothetical protein